MFWNQKKPNTLLLTLEMEIMLYLKTTRKTKRNLMMFSSISDTGDSEEKKSEFSQQELNLHVRPSGY